MCIRDSVHVGADDMPVALARKLLGPDKIVGATAKTVEAAMKAQADGCLLYTSNMTKKPDSYIGISLLV